MAKHYTGIDGALFIGAEKVAETQSWTFSANAAALPTTTLGDFAETAVYGLQSFSGTATIYYYETAGQTIDGAKMLSDVFRTDQTPTEPTAELRLQYLNGSKTREVRFMCLLNQVNISATAGEIVTAEISFQVTGPLTTSTIA